MKPPAGWERTDPRPWTKLNARWHHTSGWFLEHCGHPTANHPWALFDPKGRMHTTGGLPEFGRKPWNGYAWDSLAQAWDYVTYMLANPKSFRWPKTDDPRRRR